MKKEDFDLLCRFVAILHINMRAFFSMNRFSVKEAKVKEELTELLRRMAVSNCGDCDLVVEAAIENMEIKKQTFKELDAICKPSCIFATNTSSLSITEIGSAVERHVIGMHFFNPAPVMKLVEVIAGLNTKQEDVEAVKKISEEIGKTPVQVEEAAGFVVNRILIPMVNEAVGIYADGVASVEGIDTAMKLGANHPMGPLALGDLIGLDVVLRQHTLGDLLTQTGIAFGGRILQGHTAIFLQDGHGSLHHLLDGEQLGSGHTTGKGNDVGLCGQLQQLTNLGALQQIHSTCKLYHEIFLLKFPGCLSQHPALDTSNLYPYH